MQLQMPAFAAPFAATFLGLCGMARRGGEENSEETLYRLADFVKQNRTFAHRGLCSHRSSSVPREIAVKTNVLTGKSEEVSA